MAERSGVLSELVIGMGNIIREPLGGLKSVLQMHVMRGVGIVGMLVAEYLDLVVAVGKRGMVRCHGTP